MRIRMRRQKKKLITLKIKKKKESNIYLSFYDIKKGKA
jgi:hypothetical protein